uniref:Transmembrane protein n=1 Tax=Meloidogyne incognita TaxID=6306 RepID=A0A914MNX0_MELIC
MAKMPLLPPSPTQSLTQLSRATTNSIREEEQQRSTSHRGEENKLAEKKGEEKDDKIYSQLSEEEEKEEKEEKEESLNFFEGREENTTNSSSQSSEEKKEENKKEEYSNSIEVENQQDSLFKEEEEDKLSEEKNNKEEAPQKEQQEEQTIQEAPHKEEQQEDTQKEEKLFQETPPKEDLKEETSSQESTKNNKTNFSFPSTSPSPPSTSSSPSSTRKALSQKTYHKYSSASTLGQEEFYSSELYFDSITEKWKQQLFFEEKNEKSYYYPLDFEFEQKQGGGQSLQRQQQEQEEPPPYYKETFEEFINNTAEYPLQQQHSSNRHSEIPFGIFDFDSEEEEQEFNCINTAERGQIMGNNFPPQTLETIASVQQQQRQLNNRENTSTTNNNFEHRGVKGIFGVTARLTGLVSLAIQTIVLILGCLLIGILFVHCGGTKYFNNNNHEEKNFVQNQREERGGHIVGDEPFLFIKSVNDTEETNLNETTLAEALISEENQNLNKTLEETNQNLNKTLEKITEKQVGNKVGNVWLNNLTKPEEMFDELNETNIETNMNETVADTKEILNNDINNKENQTFNLAEVEIIGNEIINPNKTQEGDYTDSETEATTNLLNSISTQQPEEESENLTKNQTNNLQHQEETRNKKQTFFEQIKPIKINFGKRIELDLLTMVRALCGIYGIGCILWLISLIGLTISLKLEIADLVYLNTFMLANITLLLLINIVAVGVIIVLQTEYHWKMLITIGVIEGGLILCFIFNVLAIVFIVIWYRYIDYMNGDDKSCLCLSAITGCIKGRNNNQRQSQQQQQRQHPPQANYTIPEATRHPQLPYIDDSPPIQQFSNF